jgi:hypothetical protein
VLLTQTIPNPVESISLGNDGQADWVVLETRYPFPQKEKTMNDSPPEAPARRRRAQEVLLGCLQSMAISWWPGADGVTIDEILRSYPQAMKAGVVPGLEELSGWHPDLADEFRAFLDVEGLGPAK